MAIRPFLAMTAAEFWYHRELSRPVGWLSCLFSPYGTGLSNLPEELPEGSLLILSDHTPMGGHDPQRIRDQLADRVARLGCAGVLLDFQRPGNARQAALTNSLVQALPCPVAVSEVYGKDLNGPIFLPSVPPSVPPEAYLAPWAGRDIWLELALDVEIITLTEAGAETTALPHLSPPDTGFSDGALHCHYRIETTADSAVFTLWRTREDLAALLEAAEDLGVTQAVGLYQELGHRL